MLVHFIQPLLPASLAESLDKDECSQASHDKGNDLNPVYAPAHGLVRDVQEAVVSVLRFFLMLVAGVGHLSAG